MVGGHKNNRCVRRRPPPPPLSFGTRAPCEAPVAPSTHPPTLTHYGPGPPAGRAGAWVSVLVGRREVRMKTGRGSDRLRLRPLFISSALEGGPHASGPIYHPLLWLSNRLVHPDVGRDVGRTPLAHRYNKTDATGACFSCRDTLPILSLRRAALPGVSPGTPSTSHPRWPHLDRACSCACTRFGHHSHHTLSLPPFFCSPLQSHPPGIRPCRRRRPHGRCRHVRAGPGGRGPPDRRDHPAGRRLRDDPGEGRDRGVEEERDRGLRAAPSTPRPRPLCSIAHQPTPSPPPPPFFLSPTFF